jgi:hypothetical protein
VTTSVVGRTAAFFFDRATTALNSPPPHSDDDKAAAGFNRLHGRAILHPATLTAFMQFKFLYGDYTDLHLADFGPQGRNSAFYPPSHAVDVDDACLDFAIACFAGLELAMCGHASRSTGPAPSTSRRYGKFCSCSSRWRSRS